MFFSKLGRGEVVREIEKWCMDKYKLNHARIICFILQNLPLSKPRKSSMKCWDLRFKFNKCSNKTCRARELKIEVFFFFFLYRQLQNNIVT